MRILDRHIQIKLRHIAPLKNTLILFVQMLICFSSFAQIEDCSNGVDDDFDCNIDSDDESCGVRVNYFTDGMDANFVIGQSDFVSNSYGATASKFNDPVDIIQDPVTKKVFVTDSHNHRIFRYASQSAFELGMDPEAVIGQTNYTTVTFGTTASKLFLPIGIHVDDNGTLWVADRANRRVLKFLNAGNIPSGSSADGVLGQSDFVTRTNAISATGMTYPCGVFLDELGTLWVADRDNRRVTWFENADSKANGAPADGVLGAPDLTSVATGVNATTLREPRDLVIICGKLYVVDATYHRVMVWNAPSSLTNGAPADMVLGQTDFTSSTLGSSQDKFHTPFALTFDEHNNLYVADVGNNRVLIFNEVGSKSTGALSDIVIGQDNFSDSSAGVSVNGLDHPNGMAILKEGYRSTLAVADRFNNRLMIFGNGYFNVDENASITSNLPGIDPSGSGGINFSILTYPEYGTIILDDPATGSFTYTGPGFCPFDENAVETITYQFTNANGSLATGQIEITRNDVGVCVEDCTNGMDDDLDCNIDCDDEDCGTRPTNFTIGMDASYVIGQDDFVTKPSGTSINKIEAPFGIATDPISGKVFVSDSGNNRILRYLNFQKFIHGFDPEIVLGQVDFTSNLPSTTSSTFSNNAGIYVDDMGTLWVADTSNDRVLRFDNAASKLTGASADGVLGQTNFTDGSGARSISRMDKPKGIIVENDGTLWVADRSNGRVLRFDNAATKVNGADADGVLGQLDFDSKISASTDKIMENPNGLVAVCNSLYVTDSQNNRVLKWKDAKTLPNGASASVVLGQINFTSNNPSTGQNRLNDPRSLTTDKYGNLYVSSDGGDRVIVFNEANAKETGANADYVLGQSNFTNSSIGLSADRFHNPRDMAMIDDGNCQYLAVCDKDNNRVVVFGPPSLVTDEETNVSSQLPGIDPSGSGGLTFEILTQPSFGSVTLLNASTGAFTFTSGNCCMFDEDFTVTVLYKVTNANGCYELGQVVISVKDTGGCVEVCNNGIDDDFNGLLDSHDINCDHDNDGVLNSIDKDLDNDGILNVDENNVGSTTCPNIVLRVLFEEDFGLGSRTSSSEAQLCFEDGSSASCSPVYDPSTYTSSVEHGEYTIISSSADADNGKYGWLNFTGFSGIGQDRMLICNPSSIGEVLYSTRIDGIVPGVSSYFSVKYKNLYPSGTGETPARVRINFKDLNGVIIHTRAQTILENEQWYNVFENRVFGNESSLIVEFVNENSTVSGNDFAMDDLIFRQSLRDCDGDGVANMYDLDSDNDGITDIAEQGNPDSDYDGMSDNIDAGNSLLLDANNNGADDNYEGDPILDTDFDLIWDILDWDSDNDGLYDVFEAGGTDADNNGRIGINGVSYGNGNGLSPIIDPSDGGTGLINNDSDTDGVMDAKEIDSDGDGCYDVLEAGFPDGDNNGYLGVGTIGSGLIVTSRGLVTP